MLFVKKNIQLMSVLALITAGVAISLIATYLYYWLHSPITLALIWLIGLLFVYFNAFLVGFKKNKYKIDTGKYNGLAQRFMEKSSLSLYKLYIKKRKIPNASAISFGRMRSITLNSSLVDILPPEQLEAVMAHEVGHHVHNDVLVGSVFGLTVLDALAFFSVLIDKSLHAGEFVLTLATIILAIGALLMGALYSRHREARADEYITVLTGKPQYQADALESMDRYCTEVLGWTMKEHSPLWYRLFTTHTPIPERVKILKRSSR